MTWICDKQGNLYNVESFSEIKMTTDDWQNNEDLKDPSAEKKVWYVYCVSRDSRKSHVNLTGSDLSQPEATACLQRITQAISEGKRFCNPLERTEPLTD